MEVTGTIVVALPETSGVSKAGKPWKKREYVLEISNSNSQYPQRLLFDFFGDRADQYPLTVGQVIKLSFDFNTREHNGRYFTSLSGWRAEDVSGVQPNVANIPPASPTPLPDSTFTQPVPPVDLAPSGPNDDLPF